MKFFLLAFRALTVCGLLASAHAAEESAARAKTLNDLQTQLAATFNAPRFGGALWGAKIVSLDSGRTWFEHHADRLLSPASNCKLFTAALALDRLGGDYRIVTPLRATTKPDASGDLRGDLIVSGRGDPSWKSRGTGKDFWATFEPFVAAIEKAGVKHITGDILTDTTYFRGPPSGAGWSADDLVEDFGAEISAVSLEDNFADVRVDPGSKAGDPGTLALVQPSTGLFLDNRVITTMEGGVKHLTRIRLPGENVVHFFGEVPLGSAATSLDVAVPHPSLWFAAALKEALVRRGIRVDGGARSVGWPDAPLATTGSVQIGEISSPPLRVLLTSLVKASQNLETDLIFAHLGEKYRATDAPPGQTSEESAVALLRFFLTQNHLPADEVRFEEGSGLSRNNLATANAIVALLQFMKAHRAAKDFFDALPIAGVDGTIKRQMKGTAAENNVHAKTGSLRYANSLSGYVTTAAGEQLAFSFMLNRYVPLPGRTAVTELDDLAVLLASFNARPDVPTQR